MITIETYISLTLSGWAQGYGTWFVCVCVRLLICYDYFVAVYNAASKKGTNGFSCKVNGFKEVISLKLLCYEVIKGYFHILIFTYSFQWFNLLAKYFRNYSKLKGNLSTTVLRILAS